MYQFPGVLEKMNLYGDHYSHLIFITNDVIKPIILSFSSSSLTAAAAATTQLPLQCEAVLNLAFSLFLNLLLYLWNN